MCRRVEWLSDYTSHRPNADRLQKQVDAFMAAFDVREKREVRTVDEAAAAAGVRQSWELL